MDILHRCCCGLDVHLKTVVACLLVTGADGQTIKTIRTFGTTTPQVLQLLDWLLSNGCTQVAMESTGVYWKPIYNLLEGQLELLVVNARHLKAVPGRKTDVKDAEWIADLLRHGLLKGSFIPPAPQRQLRELTRYRSSLVGERVRTLNRLQKGLEDANIKLASVVSDIQGVSARAMLEGLVAGSADPARLADLARGRLREKREALLAALTGRFEAHHAFLVSEHLTHLDFLDEAIDRATQEIARRVRPFETAIALLDSIPGVNARVAQIVLAEVGSDLTRFASAKQLASWAGMCPGNNASAGKQIRGQTRKGSKALRQALVEAAWAASRTRHTYLAAQYRRLSARRGKQRALVAVGHTLLTIMYYVLTRGQPYQELGGNYFDERDRHHVEQRLVCRLQNLGYEVVLQAAG